MVYTGKLYGDHPERMTKVKPVLWALAAECDISVWRLFPFFRSLRISSKKIAHIKAPGTGKA